MILIEKCYSCHLKKVRENVTGRNYKIYITLPPVTSILVYYYRTVDQRKYLGVMISIKNCDIDIKKERRKFSKCSPDVKCTLFNAFCSNVLFYNVV